MFKQSASTWAVAVIFALGLTGCQGGSQYRDGGAEVPQFNFTRSVEFQPMLSSYQLFEGEAANLTPAFGTEVLELTSTLFTDHAYKLRTVTLPSGSQFSANGESLAFPNGTVLSKTFYYLNDENDPTAGKRIIETRLLIKAEGSWNAATYVWNETQTDATLLDSGTTIEVTWLNEVNQTMEIDYVIPSANDCLTCHQNNNAIRPIGPTIRNLNKTVSRDATEINQLDYLQNIGLMTPTIVDEEFLMADYKDTLASQEDRARAYLAINCSHCHQPAGWEEAAEERFDFRYTTSLRDSGIRYSENQIKRALESGEMPFMGTSVIDHEGVELITDYLSTISKN